MYLRNFNLGRNKPTYSVVCGSYYECSEITLGMGRRMGGLHRTDHRQVNMSSNIVHLKIFEQLLIRGLEF